MASRIFNALINRPEKAKGGRGMKAPKTRVIRVPEDFLEGLDNLIQHYKERSLASPASPRYHFLNRFIEEVEDVLLSEEE